VGESSKTRLKVQLNTRVVGDRGRDITVRTESCWNDLSEGGWCSFQRSGGTSMPFIGRPSTNTFADSQCESRKQRRPADGNKVKSLQRLLTHSYSGKVLAVRRVTENTGKKTPGVDQIIWKTQEDKTQALQALKSRGYQSQPLHCPKSDGRERPLGILCMIDRTHQA
jgi:hypothetical protein